MKCPECSNGSFLLTESILIVETRQVFRDGTMTGVMEIEPVESKGWTAMCCSCEHKWHPRHKTVSNYLDI